MRKDKDSFRFHCEAPGGTSVTCPGGGHAATSRASGERSVHEVHDVHRVQGRHPAQEKNGRLTIAIRATTMTASCGFSLLLRAGV